MLIPYFTGVYNTYSDFLRLVTDWNARVFFHLTLKSLKFYRFTKYHKRLFCKLKVRLVISVGWSSSCCLTCFRGETLTETPWAENVGPTAAPHQASNISSKLSTADVTTTTSVYSATIYRLLALIDFMRQEICGGTTKMFSWNAIRMDDHISFLQVAGCVRCVIGAVNNTWHNWLVKIGGVDWKK